MSQFRIQLLIQIFIVISAFDKLSAMEETESVDLGLDNTDELVPEHLKKAIIDAILSTDASLNQYGPSIGLPRLRKAIAKLYTEIINHEINPDTDVIITVGATEALYSSFKYLSSPGDEWIVIEPFYSKYEAQIRAADAIPVFTNLKQTKTSGNLSSSDWELDREELAGLFNSKTRGIIFNNPNNPVGKVYSRDDLKFIANLARKHKIIVISDEAHEWSVYDDKEMIRIASLPGMYRRTLTIGSASKAFGVAGWRIGWIYGPDSILSNLQKLHTLVIRSANTPAQDALAFGFEEEFRNYGKPESFLHSTMLKSQEKRNALVKGFNNIGISAVLPEGGSCMLVNCPHFDNDTNGKKCTDWFKEKIGIIGYSSSLFYGPEHKYLGNGHIRFCFKRRKDTIEKAVKNIERFGRNNSDSCELHTSDYTAVLI